MEEEYLRKVMTTTILVILIVLSFFLLRPVLIPIIVGIILAYVLSTPYDWVNKRIKSKNLSSFIICIFFIIILIIPFWFLTPIIINQSIKFYLISQQIDLVSSLKTFFPAIFSSDQFSAEVGSIIQSFIKKTTNYLVDSATALILDFPTIFLKSIVVLFTLFFVLRDKKELIEYIKSLLPFSKEVEKKLFDYSKGITTSVIYGQIIIGLFQGLIAGLGFFIFGVPNALLLTLIATFAGVLPIVGTVLVWVPVAIYLLIAGNTFSAVGVSIFGLISSTIDNFLRPAIVHQRTQIHSSVILIGMIGGLFMFGVLGLILGPLILSYLLVILELYKNKRDSAIFSPKVN